MFNWVILSFKDEYKTTEEGQCHKPKVSLKPPSQSIKIVGCVSEENGFL